ncbi:GyrI-like domain-containing protein [Microbacterium sp.]|uniref:GyrI-like domain-containing protein n=1 Tax=Microbacterium sp. TaxID=51671 RepID=UPI0028122768|nr:GyrI-like domain-containing protein [Microbacterium sp.]
MSRIEIVEKPLPAVRLAARTAIAAEQAEMSTIVGPAFDAVADALNSVNASLARPIAQYSSAEDGMQVTVGYEYSGPAIDGVEIIELPAVGTAVCGVHLGAMDGIQNSWMALHEEIIARGFLPSGPCRELYVRAESDDQADWVTELQQPVTRS